MIKLQAFLQFASLWPRLLEIKQRTKRTHAFILSTDHSGSTWLGFVLGSHSKGAFLGEFYRGFDKSLRQPCVTCLEQGKRECVMLHGVEHVEADEAYRWAAGRSAARVFVDSSKVTWWPRRATTSLRQPDIRLVHLVRDPRGWLASQVRRAPGLDVPERLEAWIAENERIRLFTQSEGLPNIQVIYDDAVLDPEHQLSRVFEFLGLPYEPSALRYWEHQHHGFAANGAASMVLKQPDRLKVEFFLTGDDSYYRAARHRQRLDRRWMQELSPEVLDYTRSDLAVARELAHYGRRMTDTGLATL